MDVTAQLVLVYQVDRQLAALRSRLTGAERFLQEQVRQIAALEQQDEALKAQTRQIEASTANLEGETGDIDARIEKLRDRMNNATSNKEYKATLTEVNTLKADRDKLETQTIELMSKLDEINAQLATIQEQIAERTKVRDVAESERAERQAEVQDRLDELQSKRDHLAEQVPASVLQSYEDLSSTLGDEAMAPLEVADRKRHEYTCGSCMMTIPVEAAISLLSGKLTNCTSCQCILYLTPETADTLTPTSSKR
ncbi:MAG: hypothetical protein AAF747_02990 [Planctomycetota bacterium]